MTGSSTACPSGQAASTPGRGNRSATRRSAHAWVVALLLLAAAALSPVRPASAQQQLDSRVPIAFNRFYDFDEFVALLRRLVDAYPELLTMESLGKSVHGRDIWLVTLNNPATGPDGAKPAMYIDGSIHANEVQASETVLYSIWYLVSAYGAVPSITRLVDSTAFYFIPIVSPDARQDWFDAPHSPNTNRTGLAPFDNDGDGLIDEDGPDDLDGDGHIGVMWRKDANGTHRRDPDDPRIFVRVEPPAKGDWTFAGTEGIDNDGDGLINEDGPGGYDMNRNWPADWQPNWVQSGAGEHPLCYPETRVIAEFILSKPNIAAGQAYHNTGAMILRGPGAPYRASAYPRADLAVYEALGRAGEEMLPFYRYLVTHVDLYVVHGGFKNWLSEGLGIISFTNELWTDRRILQTGENPADDKARFRWRDRMLFGQTFTDWTELEHPDLGTVLVGGGTKWSSRSPPPFMLEEECHRNFAFTMFHAAEMPRLAWQRVEATRLGERLWQLDVEVENSSLIPTRTARAAEKRIGLPDRLTIEPAQGGAARVVASGALARWGDRLMTAVDRRPELVQLESGVPGRGRVTWRFIIEGDAGTELLLGYRAEKAADLDRSVTLDEPRP
ncbi:MAG TPA: M14 family metallopeptidase [Phycisphaerales bacterium]|nr:M14 family metallopeptidase [Phycisphaerales bacterium]